MPTSVCAVVSGLSNGFPACSERAARRGAVVGLVLRDELRRVAGCSARGADTEVAHVRNMEERLLGNTPHAGHAAEWRPAVARAEQRASVVSERSVNDIAVFVFAVAPTKAPARLIVCSDDVAVFEVLSCLACTRL